jgi:hypothetical protein
MDNIIDQNTPAKELIFTIEHATALLIASSKLAEVEVRALLADITEAERELTLREDQ